MHGSEYRRLLENAEKCRRRSLVRTVHLRHNILLGCGIAEELFQCGHHGGCARHRGFQVEPEAGFFHRFGGRGSEGGYSRSILVKLGDIFEQGAYAGGAEEYDHVVFRFVHHFPDIIENSAIQDRQTEMTFVGLEPLGNVVFGNIGARNQELFLFLVLGDDFQQSFGGTIGAEENFAFAVQDEFLQVKGDGLRNAEIFAVLGNLDFHLLANTEIMINGMAAGENNGGMGCRVNFLFSEFRGLQAFHPDERMKIQL